MKMLFLEQESRLSYEEETLDSEMTATSTQAAWDLIQRKGASVSTAKMTVCFPVWLTRNSGSLLEKRVLILVISADCATCNLQFEKQLKTCEPPIIKHCAFIIGE